MAKVAQSLVATGHVIRGVCYTKPDDLSQMADGLSAIPPERVGLNGEYDYYGLAKRIQARFCQTVGLSAAAQLSIKQRGSAVILSGKVDTLAMLDQLIQLALQVDGSSHVEIQDVQLETTNETHAAQVA